MDFPSMHHIRRQFEDDSLEDVGSAVREGIAAAELSIGRGDRIAVTVGSRGIADLELIVRSAVHGLLDLGARPFIIPAMGSHGGGTAEGQEEVLASYGVTEERVGAPVVSSMDVVEIEASHLENKVFMDKHAWEADGILLINRIKPHTDFHGRSESGLLKMAVIGLGKHRLASEIHSFGIHGLKDLIEPTARVLIETGKIKGGVGVVENAHDKIAVVEVVSADAIFDTEARLLKAAREKMPKLPVSDIDLLIIDAMGKDISGSGMDTNIIGRIKIEGETEPDYPKIRSILVTDLTEASHGNAVGIGLADVITRRLFDKIDIYATNANVVTSSFLERGKIPVIASTDAEALQIALRGAGCRDSAKARICRIRSTLDLADVLVSSPLIPDLKAVESVEVLPDEYPLLETGGSLPRFPGDGREG